MIYLRPPTDCLGVHIGGNQKNGKLALMPFAKAPKKEYKPLSRNRQGNFIIRSHATMTNDLFARIIGKISTLTVS